MARSRGSTSWPSSPSWWRARDRGERAPPKSRSSSRSASPLRTWRRRRSRTIRPGSEAWERRSICERQNRAPPLGLEGDAHRDTENHGGPERAVCLYAMEAIRGLQAEGHTIVPGAIGENVTIEGVDWPAVVPSSHVLLGERVPR